MLYDNKYHEKLKEDGFLVLRDVINPIKGIECIKYDDIKKTSLVNYNLLTTFINDILIKTTNNILNLDLQYTKYRISDNNNSADASAFHRDLVIQNNVNIKNKIPIYTCLTYFDTTTMEIIPKSHLDISMSYLNSIINFSKSIKLTLNPGDILIFYSTLLHRGIFTERLKHRRLIQLFDVFESNDDLNNYSDNILHVLGDETHSDLMIKLSKYNFTSSLLNLYGYLNSSTGYGCKYNNLPILSKNINYISSEGLRSRLYTNDLEWNQINKYIINPNLNMNNHNILDLNSLLYKYYKYNYYNRQYIMYTFILLFTIIFILYIICKLIL